MPTSMPRLVTCCGPMFAIIRRAGALPDALYRAGECSYLLDDLKSAERELGQFVKDFPRHELVEWALPYLGDSKLRLKATGRGSRFVQNRDRAVSEKPTRRRFQVRTRASLRGSASEQFGGGTLRRAGRGQDQPAGSAGADEPRHTSLSGYPVRGSVESVPSAGGGVSRNRHWWVRPI